MLIAANISLEQKVIVAASTIALLIFTCFWCTPTHVQSRTSYFALKHRLRK